MARTESEEDFITIESQDFIDRFGLTEKTNYQSWANVYREFFGKPAKGAKSALIAEVSKFLSENSLPKIVEIHKKMEEGRIKRAEAAKRRAELEADSSEDSDHPKTKRRSKKKRDELVVPEEEEKADEQGDQYASDEEPTMDQDLWSSFFPTNFFGDPVDTEKRKLVLKISYVCPRACGCPQFAATLVTENGCGSTCKGEGVS
jgi:hypothetical protein